MSDALKLKFKKSKTNSNEPFDMLPRDRLNTLFTVIDGKNGNALKLAILLLISKEDFAPSVKYICNRTGMNKPSYYRARKYLEELGIITVTKTTIQLNI